LQALAVPAQPGTQEVVAVPRSPGCPPARD